MATSNLSPQDSEIYVEAEVGWMVRKEGSKRSCSRINVYFMSKLNYCQLKKKNNRMAEVMEELNETVSSQ